MEGIKGPIDELEIARRKKDIVRRLNMALLSQIIVPYHFES